MKITLKNKNHPSIYAHSFNSLFKYETMKRTYLFFSLACLSWLSWSNFLLGQAAETATPSFSQYWHAGLAEITHYDLEQFQYRESHQGTATLIFVTEPFSTTKQVKLDDYNSPDKVNVLKLNYTKNFNTGVYPYHVMTSSFVPETGGAALKVTTTIQEWCGHVFSQINQTKKGYDYQLYSYFESAGDQSKLLSKALPEESLWAQVRINPNALPQGEFQLYPSQEVTRLKHWDYQAVTATAQLEPHAKDESMMIYTVTHEQPNKRSLTLYFNKVFPHEIEAWEEKHYTVKQGKEVATTTKATKKKSVRWPYWQMNANQDRAKLKILN